MEHQEQIDQLELGFGGRVMSELHPDGSAPWPEERCYDERSLGRAPFGSPGLVLVPDEHGENNDVDRYVDEKDKLIRDIHRIKSWR